MALKTKVVLEGGRNVTTFHRIADIATFLNELKSGGYKRSKREDVLMVAAIMAERDVAESYPNFRIMSIQVARTTETE